MINLIKVNKFTDYNMRKAISNQLHIDELYFSNPIYNTPYYRRSLFFFPFNSIKRNESTFMYYYFHNKIKNYIYEYLVDKKLSSIDIKWIRENILKNLIRLTMNI